MGFFSGLLGAAGGIGAGITQGIGGAIGGGIGGTIGDKWFGTPQIEDAPGHAKAMMDALYPGTTPFERLSGGTAGVASSGTAGVTGISGQDTQRQIANQNAQVQLAGQKNQKDITQMGIDLAENLKAPQVVFGKFLNNLVGRYMNDQGDINWSKMGRDAKSIPYIGQMLNQVLNLGSGETSNDGVPKIPGSLPLIEDWNMNGKYPFPMPRKKQ